LKLNLNFKKGTEKEPAKMMPLYPIQKKEEE